MASSDVDQKHLGRIAVQLAPKNPLVSGSLYQILGVSHMLSSRVFRARKMRKLDVSRDTKSLSNYQHILWLAREGLSVLEVYVLPYTQNGQYGIEAAVLSAKLRASFYHIFALFHNQPPVTKIASPRDPDLAGPGKTHTRNKSSNGNSIQASPKTLQASPKANQAKPKDASGHHSRGPTLRDPIGSITSDTSFVTNPYANNKSAASVANTPPPPPGLPPLSATPRPSAFILPPLNFLPMAERYFIDAEKLATAYLPGSHPLRLSVAFEHCAFIWDCMHDHKYARRLARQTIREVYHAKEGMDDEDFEDAAKMVDLLGKVMKRKSWEGTPRMAGGPGSPDQTKEEHPITREEWQAREARAVGGGLRGMAHVQDQLSKTHIQHYLSQLSRIPIQEQEPTAARRRNEPPHAEKSSSCLQHPHALAPAVDPAEESGLLPFNDESNSEPDWSLYQHTSLRMRKMGGIACMDPDEPPDSDTGSNKSTDTVIHKKLDPKGPGVMEEILTLSAPQPEPTTLSPAIHLEPIETGPPIRDHSALNTPRSETGGPVTSTGDSDDSSEYVWSPRVQRPVLGPLRNARAMAEMRAEAAAQRTTISPLAPRLRAVTPVTLPGPLQPPSPLPGASGSPGSAMVWAPSVPRHRRPFQPIAGIEYAGDPEWDEQLGDWVRSARVVDREAYKRTLQQQAAEDRVREETLGLEEEHRLAENERAAEAQMMGLQEIEAEMAEQAVSPRDMRLLEEIRLEIGWRKANGAWFWGAYSSG